ncbi:hypothetical protein BRL81_04480, partial [Xanthomonas oryzae pv. oryzae]
QRFGSATGDGNAALFQAAEHTIEKRLRQIRQRLDRQLFGAQFDQQGKLFAHMTWTFAYSLLPSGEGAPEGADEGTGEALWSLGA